jgi:hypothetical protein
MLLQFVIVEDCQIRRQLATLRNGFRLGAIFPEPVLSHFVDALEYDSIAPTLRPFLEVLRPVSVIDSRPSSLCRGKRNQYAI